MKKNITLTLLLFTLFAANAQKKAIDSIDMLVRKSTSDTQKINLKLKKLQLLSHGNLDTAIVFARDLISEAKKISYLKGEADARLKLAANYSFAGNYTAAKNNLDSAQMILRSIKDTLGLGKMYDRYGMMNAMQNKFSIAHSYFKKAIDILGSKKDGLKMLGLAYQNNAIAYEQESDYANALTNYQLALTIAERLKDIENTAYIYLNMAITYHSLDEAGRAEQSFLKAIAIAKKLELKNVLAYAYANIASVYGDMNELDKQYDFAMKAAKLGEEIGDKGIESASLSRAAKVLAKKKRFKEALKLSTRAISIAASSNQPLNIYQTNAEMGYILKLQRNYGQAIPYFEKAFKSLAASDIYNQEVGQSYNDLSECYEKTGNFNRALFTYKIASKISDSISGKENIKKATELRMNYDFEKQQQITKNEQVKKDADNKRIKNRQYFFISILGLIILAVITIVFIQFKNNKQKQRAYDLLQRQKRETDGQRQRTEDALSELQLTQSQLIQSAKMASLGELTAGIAHEIQNPLNFVNNFSEVSVELLQELKEEAAAGNKDDVIAIADDLSQNLEKINHHGKRADAIVKGMLQHSQSSSGKKEPTDINASADEYLRLAYHGLRAKDKSFNAEMVTAFDKNLPKVNAIPQDIGRVLLNLFNNAFYAVNQKQKTAGEDYKPEVSVRTSTEHGQVVIRVKDNGAGVPDAIKDKIMQPFFTTKPTGEGTGLGLSLTYDMVVKGHGGSIQVSSIEGEGSEFIVTLPVGDRA